MPIVDRATTCPFVAFEDDRDSRADQPDHRHRCYADSPPAPRALAHQDAFCLSTQFPACPIFQDWARREAARARPSGGAVTASVWTPEDDEPDASGGGPADRSESSAALDPAASAPPDSETHDPWSAADEADDLGLPPRRAARRDWAAPPPWAGRAAAAGAAGAAGSALGDGPAAPGLEPRPDEAAGLAERHASLERSLRGASASSTARDASAGPAGTPTDQPPFLADRAAPLAPGPDVVHEAGSERDDDLAPRPGDDGAPRRFGTGVARSRVRIGEAAGDAQFGPSWERPRRSEAYPTLRTRVGVRMPGTTPLLTAFIAVLVLAAILFFVVPGLLGVGGRIGTSNATPTPPASTAPAASPTLVPAATQLVYVVQKGDTLSRIASKYGVTVADIVAANHLKDANKIGEGDRLTIPTPAPSDLSGASAGPSASP